MKVLSEPFDDDFYAIVKAMKMYANQKLDEAANNLDWANCYDGGCHCGRDAHEQSILSLKDEV